MVSKAKQTKLEAYQDVLIIGFFATYIIGPAWANIVNFALGGSLFTSDYPMTFMQPTIPFNPIATRYKKHGTVWQGKGGAGVASTGRKNDVNPYAPDTAKVQDKVTHNKAKNKIRGRYREGHK